MPSDFVFVLFVYIIIIIIIIIIIKGAKYKFKSGSPIRTAGLPMFESNLTSKTVTDGIIEFSQRLG